MHSRQMFGSVASINHSAIIHPSESSLARKAAMRLGEGFGADLDIMADLFKLNFYFESGDGHSY
ncbi:MAG: hypothetical protein QOH63_3609 [Acidobacteriota bacterium]|nr:hypothetical protein [Acidobacteriota bacterium]